ncbi:MAG: 50S ribosomal protein L9 [Planctomycetes bacterium]|nr:50S ribosomal protein L9 [Planctomycetota bacterium]
MPKTKSKQNVKKRRTASRSKRLPRGPNGGIELLLVQSVGSLGKQGEVIEVKPGYANNYLLPQGLATVASEHHKRMVGKHKAKLMEIHKARVAGLKAQADELAQQSITIEANANDEGHLYGSVGATEIVNTLKGLNITLTPDQVLLTGPLKELGLYTVKVNLGQEVEAELKVWVVPSVTEEGADDAK